MLFFIIYIWISRFLKLDENEVSKLDGIFCNSVQVFESSFHSALAGGFFFDYSTAILIV